MQVIKAVKATISYAAPVAQKERIVLLDSLRGFAILGILLMNIGSFGSPIYSDPSVMNEAGVNYFSWYMMSWFFEGTQRALFSLLFGAGIVLFITNQEKKVPGLQPADIFFRRQLWLLVFGLINLYVLLWHGDILFDYAICGTILFVFRDWDAKNLLITAFLCLLIMAIVENKDLYHSKQVITRGETISVIDTSVNKLTLLQKEDLSAMTDIMESSSPQSRKKRVETAIARMTNDYRWVYETRTSNYRRNFFTYSYFGIWDVLQFMFLGMAFFKNGILLGKGRSRLYLLLCIIGLGAGLTLSHFRVQGHISSGFNYFHYAKVAWFDTFQLDRAFRTLGIFGAVMLLYKSGVFKWLFALMRAPGQMAFTNYLVQSIIALILFYGMGFALYGQLERHQLYLIVFAVWAFQIIFSHIWLRYYRFGPFEWLWRSLTYWKRQPMRKATYVADFSRNSNEQKTPVNTDP
ncbi:MAG TPA: DUF418 domain-containing protein [Flavisolibacter sp.]|nr:DUF418 domain-containing protein [Flavisolibacter sp.]